MDKIHNKWRTPKGRKRKATSASQSARASKRWAKTTEPNIPTSTATSAPKPNLDRPSTSGRKLAYFEAPKKSDPLNESLDSVASDITEAGEFIMVHKSFWSSFIANVLCPYCNSKDLKVYMTENHGFVKKIGLMCTLCEEMITQVYSSPRLAKGDVSTRPPFLCNRKVVDSFLNIGTGYCGLERLCVSMGMDVISVNAYMDHLNKIVEENESLMVSILKLSTEAVREAYETEDPSLKSQEILDIAVTFDGSWPKRGHTSLSGFASVIDITTGLVVDFVVLSKHCHVCSVMLVEMGQNATYEAWKKKHQENGECDINFSGSSGNMETEGAKILWRRSVQKNKMRYVTVLSDGDAKVISQLNELKPYGKDIKIEKEECVNHVGKRLGTALRNLVKDEKARKVTLGGNKAGSLKDSTIVKMQSYYQKAIKSNIPDIPKTKKEIMASIDHMNSTDAKPKHKNCPTGEQSWCFFNRAKAKGEKPKSHNDMSVSINDLVYSKVTPIYKRLSEEDLLSRCNRLATQNSNEALHSVIWNKCPKEIFMSRRRYEIGVTRGIGEFNMGLREVMKLQGGKRVSLKLAKKVDSRRENQSQRQEERVKTRAKKKADKKKKNKNQEPVFYLSGGF